MLWPALRNVLSCVPQLFGCVCMHYLVCCTAEESPSPSRRSNRSVSPYKETDSEEESTDTRQAVVADVHHVQVNVQEEKGG